MSEFPVGMLIGYGIICLIFDSLYFDMRIAITLIIIESIYDICMRIAKNCKPKEKETSFFDRFKKKDKDKIDDDGYNPFK